LTDVQYRPQDFHVYSSHWRFVERSGVNSIFNMSMAQFTAFARRLRREAHAEAAAILVDEFDARFSRADRSAASLGFTVGGEPA
jgi:hypothetical protein